VGFGSPTISNDGTHMTLTEGGTRSDVWYSNDGGTTWYYKDVSDDIDGSNYSTTHASPDGQYIVTEGFYPTTGGAISSDYGVSYTALPNTGSSGGGAVVLNGGQTLFANPTGFNGSYTKSTDGGQTWSGGGGEAVTTASNNGNVLTGSLTQSYVPNSGTVMTSTDGGTTWVRNDTGSAPLPTSNIYPSQAASSNGSIIYTTAIDAQSGTESLWVGTYN
jgi:photosystem II stability/assembly factor-like uncharacterized protein